MGPGAAQTMNLERCAEDTLRGWREEEWAARLREGRAMRAEDWPERREATPEEWARMWRRFRLRQILTRKRQLEMLGWWRVHQEWRYCGAWRLWHRRMVLAVEAEEREERRRTEDEEEEARARAEGWWGLWRRAFCGP